MGAGASADGSVLIPDEMIRSVLGAAGGQSALTLVSGRRHHHHHHHHHHHRHPMFPNGGGFNPFDSDDDEYDDFSMTNMNPGMDGHSHSHGRGGRSGRGGEGEGIFANIRRASEMEEELGLAAEENVGETGVDLYFCHPCGISFQARTPPPTTTTGPTVEIIYTSGSDTAASGSDNERNSAAEGNESKAQDDSSGNNKETKSGEHKEESKTNGEEKTPESGTEVVAAAADDARTGSGAATMAATTTAATTPTTSSVPVTPPRQTVEVGSGTSGTSGTSVTSTLEANAPTPGGTTTSDRADPPVDQPNCPNCPHCGTNRMVELARMPRPRRRRRLARLQHRRDERRNEAMHVQALLSALRASIVNQLEEAELNMALRQSMENYKPHMSPACKMSIGAIVDCEILQGNSSDVKISPTGMTTTVDQLSDETCCICAEDFAVGDKVAAKLPMCQHSFHSHCVKKWFEVNNTCPICRSVLPAKCQTCIDNQKQRKDMQDQADEARRRSRSGSRGGGGSPRSSDVVEPVALESTVNDID